MEKEIHHQSLNNKKDAQRKKKIEDCHPQVLQILRKLFLRNHPNKKEEANSRMTGLCIRKRKKQQREDRNTKKRMSRINEDEIIQDAGRSASEAAIGSSDRTKMFDSFENVSLGRDDSDNVVVDCPPIMPSQQSQPAQRGKEVLQDEPKQQGKTKDAEVEVHGAEVEVPHELENVVEVEQQPEPISVIMLVQPEQHAEGKDLAISETIEDPIQPIEVEHVPIINIPISLEPPEPEPCSLTLRAWLQLEPETSTAKGPVESPDEIVTNVLLSINKEESAPPFDLGTAPNKQDLEERCATWATVENGNKFETIFQLIGPKTLEAMRYNFMTMAPTQCIDLQMVSLMCHVLNREENPRFKMDVYCVPPEILTRMFDIYGTNYLDKKTKLPYLVSQMKDQDYRKLLDREKLKTHSTMELLDAATLLGCFTFKCQYSIDKWGQDQLDEFRKKIVSKMILSKENTLRVEAFNQANKMGRQTKPSAALKIPYVQVSTAELEKKNIDRHFVID
ncbi:hypothetical protein PIB30_088764 [Stylosanthes scabra]|uniref:Uncharacterized protein n=1 Tax=Stylosanthes scabra TaxID=79078 RepID=A0ABU6TTB3_9FABA|nr:hypothetical protein [Stylosanthes scabra]